LTKPWYPLLDHAAAKVGVDQTLLGSGDSFTEGAVIDLLSSSKSCESLRLEDPHAPPPPLSQI